MCTVIMPKLEQCIINVVSILIENKVLILCIHACLAIFSSFDSHFLFFLQDEEGCQNVSHFYL